VVEVNQKGVVWFIPVILILAGLWTLNTTGILGLAKQGESCGLPLPRPCQDGTLCYNGVCTPTVGGGVDRFLYSVSLGNIFCRGNLFASFACNIMINLFSAVIIAALVIAIVLLWFGEIPNVLVLGVMGIIGLVLGFFLSSVLNYFWWLVLIIIAVLGFIAFKLGIFK
jgi:hypothetical protein